MRDDDLCKMSDLPPEQCALPCHRNERLPAGLSPAEEPLRGVMPMGFRVWPLGIDAARLQQVASIVHVDALGHRAPTLVRVPRRKRPKDTARCRYVVDLEAWCTPEHTRDCRTNACQGCEPCEKTHCGFRWSCPNHVNPKVDQRTCPQCIGTARANIADIVELSVLVSAELEYVGIDGEAANLSGPAAAPDQLDARRTHATHTDEGRGWCDYPMRPEIYGGLDQHHPYAVLGRWELFFREQAGNPPPATTTVTGAAGYLTGLLGTRMPHDDTVFDPFAREIARCLTHMQEVISDSRRPETGAPCWRCADILAGANTRAPRLIKRHATADRTGASDEWICPEVPAHRWKEADYRLRIGGDYLALSEKLTADQLRRQYGITPGNIRKWAERGHVHKRGRDTNGRMLYDVRDARQREDERRGWCDHPRIRDVYPEREQVPA